MLAALLVLSTSMVAPVAAANPDRAEEIRTAAKERAEERKQKASDKIAEIKAEAEERRASIKQDVCENRKARVQNRITNLARSANNVKGVLDRMYDRVQGFYEDGQLTVSNYEALIDAIELAKAESEASLEALDSYEFTVDCANSTVAEQVDSYRAAAVLARQDLKDYRKALVDLISSLRSEHAKANQTEGSDDSSDDNSDDSSETTEPTEGESNE